MPVRGDTEMAEEASRLPSHMADNDGTRSFVH